MLSVPSNSRRQSFVQSLFIAFLKCQFFGTFNWKKSMDRTGNVDSSIHSMNLALDS